MESSGVYVVESFLVHQHQQQLYPQYSEKLHWQQFQPNHVNLMNVLRWVLQNVKPLNLNFSLNFLSSKSINILVNMDLYGNPVLVLSKTLNMVVRIKSITSKVFPDIIIKITDKSWQVKLDQFLILGQIFDQLSLKIKSKCPCQNTH